VPTVLVWAERTLHVAADFSGHLLLLVELAIVIGILFLGLGRGFGLQRLFWHENRGKQFVAGLSAALLASELFFVSYLLVRQPDFGRAPDVVVASMPARAYLLHSAAALAISLIPPIWLFTRGAAGVRPRTRWPLAAGGVGGVVVTGLLVTLGDFIAERASPGICAALPSAAIHALEQTGPCHDVVHHHVLATSFFVLLLGVYLAAALVDRVIIPPAAGLCILLALVAAALGFFSFWLGGLHVLLVVGLILLFVWISGHDPYKRRIASLASYYDDERRVDLAGYEVVPPEHVGLVRSEAIPWRSAAAGSQGKRPLVLVCASGGGLRAAVWTTGVLCALERKLPGFPYHVRLVSGASGGMVGAGAYVATIRPPTGATPAPGEELHTISRAALVEAIGQDCLSPVTQRLVFRDIPSRLLPFRYVHDRGVALEEAFRANLPAAYEKSFGDLRAGEAEGWRPSLVFTPMLAEDGRRLVVSNLDLDFLLLQEGPRVGHGAPVLYSRSGFELARLFPGALADFPVRSAARASASFPYLSPAAVLPTFPRRRVLDAGYWDNYGTSVACAWLEACLSEDARAGTLGRWLRENVSGVLLVQIRDGIERLSAEGADFRVEKRRPKARMEMGLEGLSSPVEGTLSAREAAMLFRNDEQVEVVARRFAAEFGPGFFTTATFCFRGKVSLSWALTEMEKRKLVVASERVVEEQAEALLRFWHERGGGAPIGPERAPLPEESVKTVVQPTVVQRMDQEVLQ